MNEISEKIQALVGRRIIQAEWTGNLPIDDNEGYLLTFDDGSQVLFSWYQAYDCIGVIHELRAAQQSAQTTGLQPPHGHVFIGGKCECGEEVPLPPFSRRQHVP